MLARRRIFGSAYIFHTHPAGSLSAGEPSLLELTQSFLILKALRMYLVFLNEVHSFCSFSQKLTSFFIFHRFFGVPNRHHLKNIFNHESLVLVTCLAGCKRCDPPTAVIFCAADSKKIRRRGPRRRARSPTGDQQQAQRREYVKRVASAACAGASMVGERLRGDAGGTCMRRA